MFYKFLWNIIYKNVESVCCTCETNILQVNYSFIKKLIHKIKADGKEPVEREDECSRERNEIGAQREGLFFCRGVGRLLLCRSRRKEGAMQM